MAETALCQITLDSPASTGLGANALRGFRCYCDTSGDVTHIRVYCVSSGNMKVAFCSTSGSPLAPDTILGSGESAVSVGYTDIELDSPVAVTSGSYYGVILLGDTSGVVTYQSSSSEGFSNVRYSAISNSYASGIPDPSTQTWTNIGTTYYQGAPYEISGGGTATEDTPLGATFSVSGLTVVSSHASSDSPSSGAFSYSGADISAGLETSDTPLAAVFAYLGLDVSDTTETSDTPLAAVFVYSGATITDTDSGEDSDTPLGAVFSYNGTDIVGSTAESDTPLGAVFSYDGLDISAGVETADTPLGAVFPYSGTDIVSSHQSSDNPLPGNFVYTGYNIPTSDPVADPTGELLQLFVDEVILQLVQDEVIWILE